LQRSWPRRLRVTAALALATAVAFAAGCSSEQEQRDLARQRADEALARGDRSAALEALERLRTAPSETPESLLELTSLMMRAGESPHALWILEEGLARFPTRDDLQLQAARLALIVHDPTRALAATGRIDEDSAQHLEALLLAAQAHFELGERQRGLETLSEAARRYPERSEARLAEIAALLQDRRIAEARDRIALLRASRAIQPELARRLDSLSAVLDADAGNVDEAVAALERVLDRHPADPTVWSALSRVLLAAGRGEELLAQLEEHSKQAPEEPALQRMLGELLVALGRREQAEEAFLRFVELSDSPSAHVALARYYASDPDTVSQGARVIAAAVERFPDIAMLRVLHAENLIELGDSEAARSEIEAFRARSPQDPHAEYLRARLELANGESEAATRRLLALAPRLDRAYTQLWLARALEETGDEVGALRRYGLAMQREGRSPVPALEVARLAMRRGDWLAVAAAVEIAVRRSPGDLDSQALLLEALIRSGRAAQAESRARQIAASFANDARPVALLSRALRAQGRHREAETQAATGLERFEGDPELELERALAIALQGRLGESIEALRALAEREPRRASVQSALALVLFASGDARAASSSVDRAFALEPGEPAPLVARARYFASRGDFAPAERDLRRSLALRPDDAQLHFLLGAALEGQERSDDAIAAYRRAAELDDRDFASRNNAALLLEGRGDLEDALELAQQAYGLAGSNPQVVDTLGWLYLRNGLGDRAVALLERAHGAAPHDATTQLHLALAYQEVGRSADADVLLEELSSRDGLPPALRARIRQALAAPLVPGLGPEGD